MVRNLSTTKMEMYIDEDYWITKRFSEMACDIKDTPEDMGFLSLLLQMVRPGAEKASEDAEIYFDDFLRNYPKHSLKSGYKRNGKVEGFVEFINTTDETLDIISYSKIIIAFFMRNINNNADMCFLCRDIEDNIACSDSLDVIPLKIVLENTYKDGMREILEPKGRLMIVNIDFPHSGY